MDAVGSWLALEDAKEGCPTSAGGVGWERDGEEPSELGRASLLLWLWFRLHHHAYTAGDLGNEVGGEIPQDPHISMGTVRKGAGSDGWLEWRTGGSRKRKPL